MTSISSGNRPSFDKLVDNYPMPKLWPLPALKQRIGGGVNTPWAQANIQDSCTLRMSAALNWGSAFLLPSHVHNLRTLKGADGFNYAFAVQELKAWLRSRLGAPDIYAKGKPVKRDSFLDKKGIMVFDIVFGMNTDGRTRAMGHADLWDGKTFVDEVVGISDPMRGCDFFDLADGVSLWVCPGTALLA